MKLSPCKHCGSFAHLIKATDHANLCWSVQCDNLDCGISTQSFSQQEMAVDAWNRCVNTYAHRNGETEAPTVPGQYWFKGRCHTRDLADLTPVIVTDDPEILAWLPGWDGGQFEEINYFVGQWWGPVLAPWDQP